MCTILDLVLLFFFQLLLLESNKLEWLSRHLAHDVNTHRKYYRQLDSVIEIAKTGRLMMAADAGELGKYSRKSL